MFDLEQSLCWMRYDQPDPYDGSYNLADPQSFNRYSYVQNDPVNYVDPTGLHRISPDYRPPDDLGRGIGLMSPGIHTPYVNGWMPDTNPIVTLLIPINYFTGGFGYSGGDTGGEVGVSQNPTPLEEAARIAEIVLSSNQACRDLFDTNVNPVQLLRDLRSNRAGVGSITYSDLGGVSTDGTIRNANTSGNRSGVTIRINSNPAAPFQAGYANATGDAAFRASLSYEINNAITLIHELGHAAMGLYGNNATRITRDRGNETTSIANSRLVFETCFVY